MEQWMPAQIMGRLRRFPRSQWHAFFAVWGAGLFAHGYMLANKLPNHDDIHSMFGKGAVYEYGRWGLPFLGKLDGSYSMPWMLGLFTLFLLAVAAMLIVDMMRIKSPLFAALAGGGDAGGLPHHCQHLRLYVYERHIQPLGAARRAGRLALLP